ncbi:hypothetical protein HXX76_008843 [Chlamydomonas incerta]|uniref:Uncharacterized protein n=1 Tax=Chlamydomonas incerta TaxID=51695 RepID=A0A835SYR2_CHLIN|nr:hypothetical protein HXX76_008843 [Chlamydomonas incerta]|eukprot:KAG2432498.1 hypothetical protein HXX76_008843 [Chlamydomonas incerta]
MLMHKARTLRHRPELLHRRELALAPIRPAPSRTLYARPVHAISGDAAASGALAIVGSLGIVGGTLFAALFVLEKQSKEALVRKISQLEAAVKDKERELAAVRAEVDVAKERTKENEMYRGRYGEATRDILKLERALELRDGQLESFMVVAQRQIAFLESQIKELQKMG